MPVKIDHKQIQDLGRGFFRDTKSLQGIQGHNIGSESGDEVFQLDADLQ